MQEYSLALLMFNYNESQGIIKNVKILENRVDEILIIDSSNHDEYEELCNQLKGINKVRIKRVFPIGVVEPLRMYGLKNIKSEWVFLLDADEEANGYLINNLKSIDFRGISAYRILRYEKMFDSYDYQLRLYRRTNVVYRGIIHEFPEVDGEIRDLDSKNFIIHHTVSDNYNSKRGAYLMIEAYERPLTPFYLSTKFSLFKLFKNREKTIGRHFILLVSFSLFVINFFRFDSIRYKKYRINWFSFKYTLKRYNFFNDLPNKDEIIKINEEIIKNGGLIRYLNLDDVNYVEKLTKNFKFDRDGLSVFNELIQYRYHNNQAKSEI